MLVCPETTVLVLLGCTPLALVLYHMNMSLSPGLSKLALSSSLSAHASKIKGTAYG